MATLDLLKAELDDALICSSCLQREIEDLKSSEADLKDRLAAGEEKINDHVRELQAKSKEIEVLTETCRQFELDSEDQRQEQRVDNHKSAVQVRRLTSG